MGELERQTASHAASYIDTVITKYKSLIDKSAKKANSLLYQLIGQAEAGASLTQTDVIMAIRASGMNDAIATTLGQGYQDIVNETYRFYRENYNIDFVFTPEQMASLEAIKTIDADQFNDLINTASTQVSRALNGVSSTGLPASAAQQVIDDTIKQYFNNYTSTWVDTAMIGFQQATTYKLVEGSDIEYWEYTGPYDKVTRPFCQQHMGQVKTKNEWMATQNDVGPQPAGIYKGGYNCRHILVPVRTVNG